MARNEATGGLHGARVLQDMGSGGGGAVGWRAGGGAATGGWSSRAGRFKALGRHKFGRALCARCSAPQGSLQAHHCPDSSSTQRTSSELLELHLDGTRVEMLSDEACA